MRGLQEKIIIARQKKAFFRKKSREGFEIIPARLCVADDKTAFLALHYGY